MDKFFSETVPTSAQYLEKILEKNEKCEVYCVGNKVRLNVLCVIEFFLANNFCLRINVSV